MRRALTFGVIVCVATVAWAADDTSVQPTQELNMVHKAISTEPLATLSLTNDQIVAEPLEGAVTELTVKCGDAFVYHSTSEKGEEVIFSIGNEAPLFKDGSCRYEARSSTADAVSVSRGSVDVVAGKLVPIVPESQVNTRGPESTLQGPGLKDQVFNDDVITKSLCSSFGSQCADLEVFPLTEGMKTKDAFPILYLEDWNVDEADWAIFVDSLGTGGFTGTVDQAFHIGNDETDTVPFIIENGAGTGTLYLDGTSQVGIGTTTPLYDLHVAGNGQFYLDSPLSSWWLNPGSSGLWFRVGGNWPVRFENGAPSNSLIVEDTGDLGVKGLPAAATLHVFESDSALHSRVMTRLEGADFEPQFEYTNATTGKTWRLGSNPSGQFVINQTDDLGIAEMLITPDGVVRVNGTQVHPDYVFEPTYELMGLPQLKEFVTSNGHLPGVVSAEEANGTIELTSLPLQMLEKIEELTLYTIQQHEQIELQQRIIEEQRQQNEALRTEMEKRLAAIEAQIR